MSSRSCPLIRETFLAVLFLAWTAVPLLANPTSAGTAPAGVDANDWQEISGLLHKAVDAPTLNTTLNGIVDPGDYRPDDQFGTAVDADGDRVVVGVPLKDAPESDQGLIYVYRKVNGAWTEEGRFGRESSIWGQNGQNGLAVAISGDTIAFTERASTSGRIWIFTFTGGAWVYQADFLISEDPFTRRKLGYALDLEGDTLLASAAEDEDLGIDAGAAYVYTRSGTIWTRTAKLFGSDTTAGDQFGFSVSLDATATTAVVGSRFNGGTGAAYVFTGSGGTWTEAAKIVSADAASSDQFGRGVAIDGSTLAISAPFDDDLGSASGSVYIYTGSGASWTQTAKLTATDGSAGDWLGLRLDAEGGRVIATAYRNDDAGTSSGSAYIFDGSNAWSERKLTASNAAAGDELGYAVALTTTDAFAGARFTDRDVVDQGSLYAYDLSNTSEVEIQGREYILQNILGVTMVTDGQTLAIGTEWDTQSTCFVCDNNGSVTIYVKNAQGGWDFEQKLFPPAGGRGFGIGLGLDGDNLIVGAPYNNTGSAYVYVRSGGVWSLEQAFVGSTSFYGHAVAIEGDTAIVHNGGTSLLVFTRSGGVWTQTQTVTGANDEWDAVELDGDTVVNGNRVYTLAGGTLTLAQTLAASGRATLDGDRLMVGGTVFERDGSGVWGNPQNLPGFRDDWRVDLSGDYAAAAIFRSSDVQLWQLKENGWEELTITSTAQRPQYFNDAGSGVALGGGTLVSMGWSEIRVWDLEPPPAAPVALSKSFTDDPVAAGSTVTLQYAISNPNASPATGITFSDDLDAALAGLTATTTPVAACGGTLSGTSVLSLTGGTLAAGLSCVFSVVLQVPAGAPAGTVTSTTSTVTATVDGATTTGAAVSDDLAVEAPSLGIFVNTTVDDTTAGDGFCTLREALTNANANSDTTGGDCAAGEPGLDSILFDIPGAGPHVIGVSSSLPRATEPILVDGLSQPANGGSPADCDNGPLLVAIQNDGTAAHGLELDGPSASGSTIRGVATGGFVYAGIEIDGASSNLVECVFSGTDPTGTTAVPNAYGVRVRNGGTGNIVRDNLLSGNTSSSGQGVQLSGSGTTGNTVLSNKIGTDVTGTVALGNYVGIRMRDGASSNLASSNLVSGNSSLDGLGYAVYVSDVGTDSNRISGNWIGTNAAGTAAIPNEVGVRIRQGATNTVIGSDGDDIGDDDEGNLISGSTEGLGYGVYVSDLATTGTVVAGNRIGLDAAGTGALGNYVGVRLNSGVSGVLVTDNVISGHTVDKARAVYVSDLGTDDNLVQGNWIGTDATGEAPVPNKYGVYISLDATGTVVGNDGNGIDDDAEGNVLSGNTSSFGQAVVLKASGHRVAGNLIGPSASGGLLGVPGTYGNKVGVRINSGASNNVITGNVIAGNRRDSGFSEGVQISGLGTDGNVIESNVIGDDGPSGDDLSNEIGVLVQDSATVRITGNRILRSSVRGIDLETSAVLLAGSDGNCIAGNGEGVDNTSGLVADLTGNWWGSSSGPSGVGGGTGDSVSLDVLYSTFLTTAPAGCENDLTAMMTAPTASTASTMATKVLAEHPDKPEKPTAEEADEAEANAAEEAVLLAERLAAGAEAH